MQYFRSSSEQLRAYEKLIAVYLSEYIDQVVRHKAVTDTPFEQYKGLVVSLEEAEDAVFSDRSFSLSPEGARRADELFSEIERLSACSAENGIMLPLDIICDSFGFDTLERFIIALAAMPLVNHDYEKTFGYLGDNVNLTAPTLKLALDLFSGGDYSSAPALCEVLVKYLFEECPDNPLKSRLCLRRFFSSLLFCGRFRTDYSYMELRSLSEPGYICFRQQYDEISGIMRAGRRIAVSVAGRPGSGRSRLLTQCAAESNNAVLIVDFREYSALPDDNGQDSRSAADKDIICSLIMLQCYFCVTNAPENSGDPVLKRLCENALQVTALVFLCGGSPCLPDLEIPVYSIKLPELSTEERYQLWREQGFGEEFLWEIADKFRFTPKQIRQAAAAVREKLRLGAAPEERLFEDCCGGFTENRMGDKARLIESRFTFDDLVLPENELQLLREACDHVKYRHIVYNRWNFGSLLAYGRGLTVLFAGPPGTGKTMAATIVAGELGLPAYRVDISKVMSKYIGETEKSLGEIFDIAQQSNAILFFDETDALFGKRSEIKDSHDKYANVETSFLLQRLETFDGVVLMSTNLLQNIDSAFIRRISYIINFPFPDVKRRLELWRKMFPAEMPLDGGIDFEYLAGQFELSGAAIKNTAMSAAFLAAAENKAVNMSHILRAVSKQLSKQGRLLVKEDFGKYSMFL